MWMKALNVNIYWIFKWYGEQSKTGLKELRFLLFHFPLINFYLLFLYLALSFFLLNLRFELEMYNYVRKHL